MPTTLGNGVGSPDVNRGGVIPPAGLAMPTVLGQAPVLSAPSQIAPPTVISMPSVASIPAPPPPAPSNPHGKLHASCVETTYLLFTSSISISTN